MTVYEIAETLRAEAARLERLGRSAATRAAACRAEVLRVAGDPRSWPWGERCGLLQAAAAHCRGLGYSAREIAAAVGIDRSTVDHALAAEARDRREREERMRRAAG